MGFIGRPKRREKDTFFSKYFYINELGWDHFLLGILIGNGTILQAISMVGAVFYGLRFNRYNIPHRLFQICYGSNDYFISGKI